MLEWTRRQQRDRCLGELGTLVPRESDLEVGRLVMTGDPAAAIAGTASRLSADVIVVGGKARRRLLGSSLTDELVARAPCPVLVIRPETAVEAEVRRAHAGV